MRCAARRFFVPVAAAALAVGLDALAPTLPNPAAAVATAAGHSAQRHLRAESTRLVDGQPVSVSLDVAGPARLERECQADLCRGTWFDGAQDFSFGLNAAPLHERDRDERTLRTFAAIASTAFAEPAFLSAGGRVGAAAIAADGRLRYTVTAPRGDELVAVVAARGGQLEAVERPDRSVYAPLVASGDPPARVYAAQAYDRVASVSAPLTEPSGPRANVAGATTLELRPGPLPIVPCRLSGRDAGCLIDTGTTPSAMTLAFAERLGLEPRGTLEISALGTYLTGVVDAGPLELGAATVAAAGNGPLHWAVIPHVRGPEFDVVIGSDILAGLTLELDPGRRVARLMASGAGLGGPLIEVDFGAGLPIADVRIGEQRSAEPMLVDTGDTGTVSIGYDEFRLDEGLFSGREHALASGAGATTMDALGGELRRLEVGQVRFGDVGIVAVRGQHRGHLGYGFAARCGRFLLDLGARRIACGGWPPTSSSPTTGQK